jgi:hypothetical protein
MCAFVRSLYTFIVCVGDGAEAFLSSGIPDLKFDIFAVGSDSFEAEVDSDGGHIVFVELIVCKPEKKAALAD